MKIKSKKLFYSALCLLFLLSMLYFFSEFFLTSIGKFLSLDESPSNSDAAVVLNTGLEYYPRLIEAAEIYGKGLAKRVVINGNRKTDSLRDLEKMGFESCCEWYEDSVRILELLGVPRHDVIAISVEDAYDTNTEAEGVGPEIIKRDCKSIILITSKFHTRRAAHIWRDIYEKDLQVVSVSAKSDPFDPESWWKQGRQVRWVLAEYGAWIFYYWRKITDI